MCDADLLWPTQNIPSNEMILSNHVIKQYERAISPTFQDKPTRFAAPRLLISAPKSAGSRAETSPSHVRTEELLAHIRSRSCAFANAREKDR